MKSNENNDPTVESGRTHTYTSQTHFSLVRSERRLNDMLKLNSVIIFIIQAKHGSLLIHNGRQGEIIRNACNCTLRDYQDVQKREHLWISLTAYPPYAMKTASLKQKHKKGHEKIT